MKASIRFTKHGLEIEAQYWALEYDSADDTWHLGQDVGQGAWTRWDTYECLADALEAVPNV